MTAIRDPAGLLKEADHCGLKPGSLSWRLADALRESQRRVAQLEADIAVLRENLRLGRRP